MITAVPDATPVTTPLAEPTVAIPVLLLDHVPPLVVLLHVADDPLQITVDPAIVCGVGAVIVTVFVAVLTQPLTVTEYVINDVPAETPVTMPEEEPIVATPVLPLVHVPPLEVLDKVPVAPEQIEVVPEIVCAVGEPFTTVTVPHADGVQEPLYALA